MIPKDAKPHEVAILTLWQQGKNTKQIAYELHYRYTQPVRRVITRWESTLLWKDTFLKEKPRSNQT